MNKIWLVLLVAVMMASAVSNTVCLADTPQERVIRMAKEAAENEGIVVGEAELIYDPTNKRWEERVAAIEQTPADPNYGMLPHGILQEKKYETVLLDFKEDSTSADAWVFIDKDTGDVLTVYQEE